MGSFSDYLEAKVLDHVFGKTTFTAPATVYMGLFTGTPSDSGGGTEVTGGSYARASNTNDTTTFPNASGTAPTTKTTGDSFDFPQATADWGTVTSWGLFDASSAGNLLCWGALTDNRSILSGDTPSFASAALSITLD